jgi:hypothetical protein
MTRRSVRWAIAALLIVAAAAAGIAANVVLLGLSQQGAADPVGHFKPQLGLASTTYETRAAVAGAKGHSTKKHPRLVESTAAQQTTTQETTSPASSGSGSTTEPEREPGEDADD